MGYLGVTTADLLERAKERMAVISLFTGAGGIDVGFGMAGLKTAVMVEFEKSCCETLRANWWWERLQKRTDSNGKLVFASKEEMKKKIRWYHEPEPAILEKDICKTSTEEILKAGNLSVGEAIAVVGGPPCQGFSFAGKRVIEDPRNRLYKEFVRVVRGTYPKFILFENVPGLASMAKGEIIKQICVEFANSGYQITWDILNAADYGVPQHRRRIFLIGIRIDVMKFPETGRPQLHIAALPGEINHPEWFREKHGMVKKGQMTFGDYKKPESIEELLVQLMKKSSLKIGGKKDVRGNSTGNKRRLEAKQKTAESCKGQKKISLS